MSDKKWYCCLIVCFVLLTSAGSNSQDSEGKKQVALAEKVQKLTELSMKDSVIDFNGDRYRRYAKESPRNYSIVVMLTALKPERQCGMCIDAKQEYQIVADSWRNSRQWSTDLFFALLDFDVASDIFQDLQMKSVPTVMHFPAKGKRKKGDTMERTEMTATNIASWVHRQVGIKIKVHRPINYTYWASAVVLLTVVGGMLYYLRNKLHFLLSPTCLAIPVLIVILSQISGYMWNQIRKPPNMIRNPRNGEAIYIHPSRGSQLVFETYIIMLLYSSMLAGFIMLNEINSLKRRWCKAILALAGLACVLVFFCALLHVFKTKTPYYPYGFFDLVNDYVWKM